MIKMGPERRSGQDSANALTSDSRHGVLVSLLIYFSQSVNQRELPSITWKESSYG